MSAFHRSFFIPAMLLTATAFAQSPPPMRVPAPQQKQIDIGAEQAPLSDQQREELAAAVSKHNYAAEKAVIDKAVAEHPDSRELQIMAGRLAYLEKHPQDTVTALETADRIAPIGEDDRVTLALADAFTDRIEQAKKELAKLKAADPKNAQYPYLEGRFAMQKQRFQDAVLSLRQAVALDPDLIRAYQELGEALEAIGEPDGARKVYEEGARRNRTQKTPWEWSPVDLGVVLLKSGELDEAEALFREGLRYNHRMGWAHYYLAQVAEKRGNRSLAVTEYQTAVVDLPTLRQAWLALGREYTRLGQKEEAARCLAIFKRLEDKANAQRERKVTP